MRILHTSDWHLGRTFHGRVLDDAHAAFADHLVGLVAEERIDAVIVAGDVYDRAIPPNDSVALLDDTLRRLTERARVILTPGNHDSARRLGFAADLMGERLLIRARVGGLDRGIVLPDADGRDALIIHALPYLDPDAARESLPPLLAERLGERIGSDVAGRPGGEAADGAPKGDASTGGDAADRASGPRLPRSHEAVVAAALRLVAPDLARLRSGRSARLPSLLMAHAFVVGGQASDSERDIRVGGVDSIPAGVFAGLGGSEAAGASGGLDYVALGHLHRPQELARPLTAGGEPGPRLAYSGSPLPFSFDETGAKSSIIVGMGPRGVESLERVDTPAIHRVATVRGTMDELLSPAHDGAVGAWVRAILVGERPPGALATLKERFPDLLAFSHEAPARAQRERIAVTSAIDPMTVAEGFLQDVTGRAAAPSELDVMRGAYEAALADGRSAR
ncbi:metallophosphoesterase family protein [Actinomyces marmotae]|uniref:metallophosphoesterase family protein n=1 Tax=Actinomyces marmotae TaxID=2737173 RepID=UPI001356AFB8|nr:exonuclease subunit SbcD [Actinomyces marmotae]